MTGALLDMIWGPLGGLLAALVALLAAWAKGRREGRQAAAREVLNDYRKTRERIDDAASDIPDDPSVLRDWLRERGKQ